MTETEEMLIDVQPENVKDIVAAARQYKKHQTTRIAALKKETEYKDKVKALVKESGIKPLANGVIKFSADGFQITITPRDELIEVRDNKQAEKE